ncbi:MAG TPA: lipopolysaccharide biosynthesis protein [Beijerinckiaceae bacterium]|nr:lipopolysaccharide biosynthesis protein [Beijerinckiaceae bacterium]
MLIRHTILYLPAQLIGPLFQFIAAVAWTHWLAPDAYGILAFVLATQDLAYLVGLSWWSQFTLRYLGTFKGSESRAVYQRSENCIILLSSLLQAAMAVGALVVLKTPLTPTLVGASILYIVTRSITAHLGERARTRGEIVAYTVAQLFGPVVGFLIALGALSHIAATPEWALAGFAVAQFVGLVWLWSRLGLGFSIAWPDRAIFRKACSFGMPLVFSGAIAWFSINGIRVIVEHMQGIEAVGLISVGWGLGQRLASVAAMLVTAAAFPLAVKHLQAGARDAALTQLSQSGAILFGLLAPSAIGIILLTNQATNLLIAEPFRPVTLTVLPIAAIAGLVRNIRVHFADQSFLLFERPKLTLVINAVEAIGTLAGCWVGIEVGGLTGAAAGALAGALAGAVTGFAMSIAFFGLPIPVTHVTRILAATAAMAIVLRIAIWADQSADLALAVAGEIIVGGFVYVGVLAILYAGALRDLLARRRPPHSAAV